MKKITKPISIILSVLMILAAFTALPVTANAAETAQQAVGNHYTAGTSGGCEWILDEDTGVMTISPVSGLSGRMEDYFSDNQPWGYLSDSISSVVIEYGVKHIGEYSFSK